MEALTQQIWHWGALARGLEEALDANQQARAFVQDGQPTHALRLMAAKKEQ